MENTQQDITLKRQFSIVVRMLSTAWDLRKSALLIYFFGASLEICGSIAAIYATARLGGLLAYFVASGDQSNIWLWVGVDVLAGLVTGFGFLCMSYATRLLYFAFVRWATNSFLTALTTIDFQEFYNETTRNQINKVGSGYTWQMAALSDITLSFIYGVVRFLAITVVVAQITWWIVPLIAIFLIPTLVAESRLAKLQWFVWDEKGDQRYTFWGLESILRRAKSQLELRSSQASGYVLRRINAINKEFYQEQETRYKKTSKLLIITKFFESAGTAIGAVVVLRQLLSKSISLERYFFLSGALLRIGGALNTIFGTLTRIQDPLLFADSYFSLIDQKPQIVDVPNAHKIAPGKTPDIVFENISFSYPEKEALVFENLNLHIKPGEHVALVGENGAGKSTLIKLLLRFYRPTSGRILIDGKDLDETSIESWYDHIATLFQSFNEYPLPIDENIQIGRSNAKHSQKKLETAADFGGVLEMTKNYTHGWKTVLDSSFKKGIEPSGGQWQRVALSRAFYRQANILILDEPTSAIDAKAEYDIFNNIFEQYKNKTALIVSHRFSTVRRADRIIVLDAGKIVEQGTHKELIKLEGLYEALFTKQAEGYRD